MVTAARVFELLEPSPQIAEQIECLLQGKALLVDDAIRHIGYAQRPFTHAYFNKAQTVGLVV